jgi:CRP-like cAMP-binding protein
MAASTIEPGSEVAQRNLLLAALPADVIERWAPHLEPIGLPLGQSIYEPGIAMKYAYFPATALVSLLYVMATGASTEIAVVGNDGMVGVSLFMGGGSTPSRAVVQSAGTAVRLPVKALMQEFNRGGPAASILLRFTQALITQMTQTAACNRHHTIDQQLCRWLLLSMDRLPGHELVMTQDLISNMLGVRREGVTEAASRLQRDRLIRYSRGRITVLDRPALELRVCECYGVVRKEYRRLLPEIAHRHAPKST